MNDYVGNEDLNEILRKNSKTISVLEAPMGGRVYLVGTAHFSEESQKEVSDLIRFTQPNAVVLELCASRENLLKLSEESILRQSESLDYNQLIVLIKKTSVFHGILHFLLIRLYAHLTSELKLVPGGEFRAAFNEAQKVPDCKVILGDLPIEITLKRSFGSLPWYRKLKLAWTLITNSQKLTQEDIEQLKNTDLLDALLKEFGASFPEFKTVLVDERDLFLTNSLKQASKPVPNEFVQGGFTPACVVGVVGFGHTPGIKSNWDKEIDIRHIIRQPEVRRKYRLSATNSKYLKVSVFLSIALLVGYQFVKRT